MSYLMKLVLGDERRAPQPLRNYSVSKEVMSQLLDLPLRRNRPLLIVDADEVLLDFASHLDEFLTARGYNLDLTHYRTEGPIVRLGDGGRANRQENSRIINEFFKTQTPQQRLAPGAAEAIRELQEVAQIVVLSNVPFAQRADRMRNLSRLGLRFPLVANMGGKGRAARFMWDRTTGPVAFIDDSDRQLASVARRAPKVARVHFVADTKLRKMVGKSRNASAHPQSWSEAQETLTRILKA